MGIDYKSIFISSSRMEEKRNQKKREEKQTPTSLKIIYIIILLIIVSFYSLHAHKYKYIIEQSKKNKPATSEGLGLLFLWRGLYSLFEYILRFYIITRKFIEKTKITLN